MAHSVELIAAKEVELSVAETAVDGWLNNRAKVLEDQESTITVRNSKQDGSGVDYFHALFRFDYEAEDDKDLLDEIDNALDSAVSWHAVRYHICDHDMEDNIGCTWDKDMQRANGTIPQDIIDQYV